MIVVNQTIKIIPSIAEAWLDWQIKVHIPEILATGLFDDFKIFRLHEQDNEEGPTFVIQLFTDNLDQYQTYIREFAMLHREKSIQKWGDQFIAFRTVMERVQ